MSPASRPTAVLQPCKAVHRRQLGPQSFQVGLPARQGLRKSALPLPIRDLLHGTYSPVTRTTSRAIAVPFLSSVS